MHSRAVVLCLAACLASASACLPGCAPAFLNETVMSVNEAETGWKASLDQPDFIKGLTMDQAKGLMGARKMWDTADEKVKESMSEVEMDMPENFDSSKHWPQCKTIMEIRDQSACGSCWAFGAAEAMSDRYCTMGGDTSGMKISAGDLMSCCSSCGNGCEGGYPIAAWRYWVSNGLPTTTCDPYPFPKCEHHTTGKYPTCPKKIYPTPPCNTTCDSTGKAPTLHYGSSAYNVFGEKAYMKEIMTNGPIEVAFTVYQDFLTYKSGVYQHLTGSVLGGHAVKMIGWGVTSTGKKYWIVNNSWNPTWGMNGQFWILRGVDECGIETSGAAGAPKMSA